MADSDSSVGFRDMVLREFAFMEKHHYKVVESSDRVVSYESARVRIVLSHNDRDGEVSLAFGRRGRNEAHSFLLYLNSVNLSLAKALGDMVADTPQELHDRVAQLREALVAEGMAILRGEDSVFDGMEGITWWQFRPEVLRKE